MSKGCLYPELRRCRRMNLRYFARQPLRPVFFLRTVSSVVFVQQLPLAFLQYPQQFLSQLQHDHLPFCLVVDIVKKVVVAKIYSSYPSTLNLHPCSGILTINLRESLHDFHPCVNFTHQYWLSCYLVIFDRQGEGRVSQLARNIALRVTISDRKLSCLLFVIAFTAVKGNTSGVWSRNLRLPWRCVLFLKRRFRYVSRDDSQIYRVR